MKKIPKKICIVLLILLGAAYYLLAGSPIVNWNNDKLAEAVLQIDTETVTLEELVPFSWDAVYAFDPYTSHEEIEKVIGFNSFEIRESMSDHASYLFFVKENKIVSNPENGDETGYYISLPSWRRARNIGSGNAYLYYGDNITFELVERNGGKILQPVAYGTTENFTYGDLKLQISGVYDMRTETITSEMGEETWECTVCTYYPGAKIKVLNADWIEDARNGQIYTQWMVHRQNEENYTYLSGSEIGIEDDKYPFFITQDMQGIYHYESRIYVLKFEPYGR